MVFAEDGGRSPCQSTQYRPLFNTSSDQAWASLFSGFESAHLLHPHKSIPEDKRDGVA